MDWTLMNARTASIDNSVKWYFGLEDEDDAPPRAPAEVSSSPPRADDLQKGNIRFSEDNELRFCQGFRIGSVECHSTLVRSRSIWRCSSDYQRVTTCVDTCVDLGPSSKDIQKYTIFHLPWFGAEADFNAEFGTFTFGDESTAYFDKVREKGCNPIEFGGSFFGFDAVRWRLGLYQVAGRPFKDYFPKDIANCPEATYFSAIQTIIANLMSWLGDD
ncbi:hypothetical protein BKA65DRAFT_554495 [Rhexocercosporidium sp. MPI-PUGE-AT-0058]|nr:hypothetical protein BKA65DRAFT_554495 [Rhexocercosporidium sp. MPI-PUGE-AT-0058]